MQKSFENTLYYTKIKVLNGKNIQDFHNTKSIYLFFARYRSVSIKCN